VNVKLEAGRVRITVVPSRVNVVVTGGRIEMDVVMTVVPGRVRVTGGRVVNLVVVTVSVRVDKRTVVTTEVLVL
jgi:hypothetical protein